MPVPKISEAFAAASVLSSISFILSLISKNIVSSDLSDPSLLVTDTPNLSNASLAVPTPSDASCIFLASVGNALLSVLKSVPPKSAACLNLSNTGTARPVFWLIFSN